MAPPKRFELPTPRFVVWCAAADKRQVRSGATKIASDAIGGAVFQADKERCSIWCFQGIRQQSIRHAYVKMRGSYVVEQIAPPQPQTIALNHREIQPRV